MLGLLEIRMNTVHNSTVSDMYLYLSIAIGKWETSRIWIICCEIFANLL